MFAAAHGSAKDICGRARSGGILAAMHEMAEKHEETKVSQGHQGWFITEDPPQLQLRFQPESHLKTHVHNSKAFIWALISGKIK